MFSGVTIFCFAASYTVALALEITRLFFRSGIRGAIMLGFAGAGLFAHTVFLAHHAVGAAGSPLSSTRDWYLLAAWLLVVVYLYLTYYHPKTSFGLFILPLVLGLVGVGAMVADTRPFAREPASKIWGAIHGISILLATVSVLVAFAAGLMYLGQAYRLKHKLPPMPGLRLPSLEWLGRANSRAIVISLLLMGVGILAGVVLNVINYGRQMSRLPWYDPLVLSTVGMFGWLLLSVLVGVFYKPAREGRKVAYLTVVSFVFLVIALGIGMSVATQHSSEEREDRGEQRGERVQGSGFGVQKSRVGNAHQNASAPIKPRPLVAVQAKPSSLSPVPCSLSPVPSRPSPLPSPSNPGSNA